MVEVSLSEPDRPVKLFNSPLETGVRAVVFLDAAYPRSFDLTHLTWFDHLVVHTADISGPTSLHPDIPQRTGELLVRRKLVEEGIDMMRRLHLIDAYVSEQGVLFQAREEATAFVDSLRSSYATKLKERARWLATYLARVPDQQITAFIAGRVSRWAVEFQGEVRPGGLLL